MVKGMSRADWENFPLADLGRDVVINRVTISQGSISGDASYVWGANEIIRAIYAKRGQSPTYLRDVEGIFKGGDAFIQAKISSNLSRMDKVTVDGIVYKVDSVKRVPIAFTAVDQALFDFCTLIKIQG